ncbi:EZH inhibitory protein isoform X2 [Mus caroli]|uniref:EZH inhibitory protein isoform X2 n=1 Tax=Mus caroli TaxID=10089 RepID=A0A6P5PA68_MUSCR|nr:EZH inhibitory protein isoform X2 [Mus caroli]
MASSSSPERELETLRDTDESEGEAPGSSGPRGRGAGSALHLRSLEAEMAAACVTSMAVGNLEAPGPTLRSSTARGSGSTPVPKALRCAESSHAGSDQSSSAGRELRQQASPQAPDDGGGGGGPDPRGSGTPEGWVLRSRVVPFGRRSSASEVSPEAQSTGWNLRPRPRSSASAVSPEARPEAQSAGRNLRPRPRSSASVVSPESRSEAQSAGWNLRPRPRSSASVVSPEARSETQSAGWNLRPRATPRVPVAPSSTTRSSSDRGSSRATRSRSRSRSCSTPRLGSDHRQSHKIKMRLKLEVEPEPESEAEQEEQELEPEPGPSSPPQASRSSSRLTVPGRSSLAAEDSPPRRPVRMRASSPSPPGRLYPLPKQYFEGSRSPSSSSSESPSVSSSHSPLNKSPDPSSSPPLSSLSGPNPFLLALIADLNNLDSSSPRVPGEEIEAAPHTHEEEDKKYRG